MKKYNFKVQANDIYRAYSKGSVVNATDGNEYVIIGIDRVTLLDKETYGCLLVIEAYGTKK